jgi:hypothetical protein
MTTFLYANIGKPVYIQVVSRLQANYKLHISLKRLSKPHNEDTVRAKRLPSACNRVPKSQIVVINTTQTKQEENSLMASRQTWSHRSYRRCAGVFCFEFA